MATSRLAKALVFGGAHVIRIVGRENGVAESWETEHLEEPAGVRDRLVARAVGCLSSGLSERYRIRVRERSCHRRLVELFNRLKPDVINVHNLHSMQWSPSVVEVCREHAPTIWTLHDMWSFTARCPYAYDCRKFQSGCDSSCPTSAEYPAMPPNRIGGAWNLRSRLFASHPDLVAVCPSRWLRQEALSGFWAGHRVEHIPYGLPLEVYRTINRDIARQALGIEAQGSVVLVAAQDVTERRKGGHLLADVFRAIRRRPLTVVTLGSGKLTLPADGLVVCPLGYVDHERTRVLAYNAADILLHPAPVDNLPNVVMEAISCGTPCAAFPVGGLPDMVRPGVSGWLARDVSPRSLAEAVDEGLDAIAEGTDLRESCRKLAEDEYDARMQAQRYFDLFDDVRSRADG